MSWFKRTVYIPFPQDKMQLIVDFLEKNPEREFEMQLSFKRNQYKLVIESYEIFYFNDMESLFNKLPNILKYINAKKELK